MSINGLKKALLFAGLFSVICLANAENKDEPKIIKENDHSSMKIIEGSDIVELISHYDFDETVRRITNSIDAKGLTLFAIIDHTAAAHDAELNLLPKVVLIFGSPVAGTPIMQQHPSVALDLPFRVLISETEDKTVNVSYHLPDSLVVHGLSDEQIDLLSKLTKLVNKTIE